MPSPWLENEPGLRQAVRELARLKNRARRRPILTLSLALIGALAVVGMRLRSKQEYEAHITFLMKESRFGEQVAPAPPRELRDYLFNGIFTKPRCEKLVKKYELFPSQWRLDKAWAVESMREAIDIDVSRNYFLLDEWQAGGRDRTAKITIRFTYIHADTAWNVVRDLGEMIREEEQRKRVQIAALAKEEAAFSLKTAREELFRLQREVSTQQIELLIGTDKHRAQMDTFGLQQAIEHQKGLITQIEQGFVARAVSARRESNAVGLRFEQVDWRQADVPTDRERKIALAFTGVVVFVILLPISAMIVGTFDSKIYEVEDVRRLGLVALGKLPRFKGSNRGALATRKDRTKTQGQPRTA
jgi:hypothetical protein